MSFRKKVFSPGFTLIELTVVMAIIAILATISIVSYSGSQAKARDGRRKAELRQLQTALEAYYNDNKHYPTDTTHGGTMSDIQCASYQYPGSGVGNCWSNSGANGLFGPNGAQYIPSMPQDPALKGTTCNTSGVQAYAYFSPDGQSYYLYTHLENPSDPQITNPVPDSSWCSPFANYEVKNP